MKKVLLTGGTGFVGKNILPFLNAKYYNVFAPSRQELDLRNTEDVKKYVERGNFDVILHSANPNPVKNPTSDSNRLMFEDSLRIFMNFYNVRNECGKLIYIGSGAEYDKTRDLKLVTESQIGERIPKDIYGFAKYIMNELSSKCNNIYNLRLFACYGPYDFNTKFITHAINCCLRNEPVTIRQDCYFDYMHVFDLANIICWFIDNVPKYADYNISTAVRMKLSEIAQMVSSNMNSKCDVEILSEGFNKEYTADNSRLLNEMHEYKFISIEDGIKMQIDWERGNSK